MGELTILSEYIAVLRGLLMPIGLVERSAAPVVSQQKSCLLPTACPHLSVGPRRKEDCEVNIRLTDVSVSRAGLSCLK